MEHVKEHLEAAFEQGRQYDYRPNNTHSFNRWYNETFLDKDKCIGCKYFENTVQGRKTCRECNEFESYEQTSE